jgi:hypothetical protein
MSTEAFASLAGLGVVVLSLIGVGYYYANSSSEISGRPTGMGNYPQLGGSTKKTRHKHKKTLRRKR